MGRRLIAVTVLAVLAVGCGSSGRSVGRSARSSTTTVTTARSTSTTTHAPSAADDLAAYFAAAQRTSDALAAAARKINGGVAPDRLSFDQATVDAVAAADPTPAAALIPAGLPPELLRAVLVVQSELVSRFAAMRFVYVGTYPTHQPEADQALECLANGAHPAARFATDLATAHSKAAALPPVTPVPPDSRAAAELAIRLADIGLRNHGCMNCGGFVVTEPAPIVWSPQPSFLGDRPWDGTIGGVRFRATYTAGSGWNVELNAC
jgi:hypothetical protein